MTHPWVTHASGIAAKESGEAALRKWRSRAKEVAKPSGGLRIAHAWPKSEPAGRLESY